MKKSSKRSKLKFRNHRHQYFFKIPHPLHPRRNTVMTSWAKVINGTKRVELILSVEDVQRSVKNDGVGSTQTCSMALCALRQEKAFPHPVEGYIDWQPSRAYIVSKLDSNGMPGECVVYTHDDDIALVNDSEKGQKKLLADLIANGPRKIVLLPIRKRAPVKPDPINHGWKPEDQRKSKRSPDKVLHLRGAQRRFAIAQRGGVDEAKIEKLLERKGKKGKQLKIPFGEAATG